MREVYPYIEEMVVFISLERILRGDKAVAWECEICHSFPIITALF